MISDKSVVKYGTISQMVTLLKAIAENINNRFNYIVTVSLEL